MGEEAISRHTGIMCLSNGANNRKNSHSSQERLTRDRITNKNIEEQVTPLILKLLRLSYYNIA